MKKTRALFEEAFPLSPFLSAIKKGVSEKGIAVIRADPGSGKSTLLPLSLLEENDGGSVRRNSGKILLLEPRRAAALGIAVRMAELLGEKAGERVGYAVRLERKVSSRTIIEVITEGLFIRRLQADPSLAGIGTVILDEFHERAAFTDLALAFLLDLRRMGSPVKIIIMSATIDAGEIAASINRTEGRVPPGGEVPVFDVPGRIFPVALDYRPLPGRAPLGMEAGTALPDLLQKGEGDTLVFLPGRREISDAERTFRFWEGAGDFELLPLHGGIPLAAQREICVPGGKDGRTEKRRVILATNIAESALTIPGITLVVDSGYTRIERFHVPTALNRLSLEEASLASAEQRAGRAGRLGPGRCVRLWEPGSPRPVSTEPEIKRVDLSGTALECLLWGIRGRKDLPWLEAPPEAAWERALDILLSLGAIDRELNPTALGKETVRLGLEPRLGILCLTGKERGSPGLACAAAAALSARDGSMIEGDSDFRARLELLRKKGAAAGGVKGEGGRSRAWVNNVMELRSDLLRRLKPPPAKETGYDAAKDGDIAEAGRRAKEAAYLWKIEEETDVGELLARAFPDRLAMRQKNGRFRFVSGREARVEGPLQKELWLIASEVDAGERAGFIRLGAPVSEESALRLLESQTLKEIRVEWTGLVPRTLETRRAGRLLLREVRRVSSRKEAEENLPGLLREKGLDVLPWEEGKAEAGRLLERIRFFSANAANAAGQKDWTDEALIHDAVEWLAPFIEDTKKENNYLALQASSLINALENRFGWEFLADLNREVPANFTLPSGRKKPVKYVSGEPVLVVRLQDCFGISVHPRIMGVPLVFHLLSPADRPVQITSDIAGFWAGSYADVRKDMKGRYPKHSWPEDPNERQ